MPISRGEHPSHPAPTRALIDDDELRHPDLIVAELVRATCEAKISATVSGCAACRVRCRSGAYPARDEGRKVGIEVSGDARRSTQRACIRCRRQNFMPLSAVAIVVSCVCKVTEGFPSQGERFAEIPTEE